MQKCSLNVLSFCRQQNTLLLVRLHLGKDMRAIDYGMQRLIAHLQHILAGDYFRIGYAYLAGRIGRTSCRSMPIDIMGISDNS